MSERLHGKKILVTAATQGIGRACAIAFAREGADVLATGLNKRELSFLEDRETNITAKTLDVTQDSDILRVVKPLKTIDVLFNCAGFVHQGAILECTEQDWDFSFDINVKSMYRMLRVCLPKMLENGGGNIINMSSSVSSLKAAPNRFVYGATKAAVIGLTKSVAKDFSAQGIRCNAICPGTVESPSLLQRLASQGDVKKARATLAANQPLGRLGTPEEIAHLAVYLASDESSFVTGTVQIADGGWTL